MDNKNLFVWKNKKKKEKEPKEKRKKEKEKIYKKKKAQSGDWECVFQYETFETLLLLY